MRIDEAEYIRLGRIRRMNNNVLDPTNNGELFNYATNLVGANDSFYIKSVTVIRAKKI